MILHSVSLLDKEVCGVWTMTLPCPKKFKRPHRTPTFNRPVSIPKSRLQMVYLDLVTSGRSDYCGKQLCNGYQHTLEPPFTKQQPLGGSGLRKTRAAASQQKPLSWEFMGNGSKKTPWNKIQIQRKPFLRGNHIHTYLPAYVGTYVRAYIHTYIHTYCESHWKRMTTVNQPCRNR